MSFFLTHETGETLPDKSASTLSEIPSKETLPPSSGALVYFPLRGKF